MLSAGVCKYGPYGYSNNMLVAFGSLNSTRRLYTLLVACSLQRSADGQDDISCTRAISGMLSKQPAPSKSVL